MLAVGIYSRAVTGTRKSGRFRVPGPRPEKKFGSGFGSSFSIIFVFTYLLVVQVEKLMFLNHNLSVVYAQIIIQKYKSATTFASRVILTVNSDKDIYEHPDQRLVSRTPLWNDLEPCDLASQWREFWETALVMNSSFVADPTIHLPGY